MTERNSSASGIFKMYPGERGHIIAFAPGGWAYPEFAGSPRYHLWGLAGMGWKVLYVEPPKKLQLLTRMWKAPDREFHVLTPARVAPFGVRAVPNEKTGDAWRTKTAEGLVTRAQEAAKSLNMKPSLWWFGAPWHSAIAKLAPENVVKVAHIYDELSASPALEPHQRTLLWDWERELLRMMDTTICSSEPQMDRRVRIAPRLVMIENAVSEEHLPENRKPPTQAATVLAAKVSRLPSPRLMYGGTVDLRLDEQMFTLLATSFQNGSLIFAGHYDDNFPERARKMFNAMPNVHFLGDVPYSAFPWIYSHADALLLAHKRMEFTNGMYPEKINEYLASGKPIVSVSLPEIGRLSREMTHPDVIRVADTPADFIEACRTAVEDKDPEVAACRVDLARAHLWGQGAERLDRELMRLTRMKSPA